MNQLPCTNALAPSRWSTSCRLGDHVQVDGKGMHTAPLPLGVGDHEPVVHIPTMACWAAGPSTGFWFSDPFDYMYLKYDI